MNYTCHICRFARWFLVPLEFDFTLVVNKGMDHQREDHFSRIIIEEAPTRVNDDLPYTYLFNVEMTPSEWSRNLVPLLTIQKWRLNDSMDRNLFMVE